MIGRLHRTGVWEGKRVGAPWQLTNTSKASTTPFNGAARAFFCVDLWGTGRLLARVGLLRMVAQGTHVL